MLPSWRKRCHVMNNGAAGKTASTMKASMALVALSPPYCGATCGIG
jgi:hypothetical protein